MLHQRVAGFIWGTVFGGSIILVLIGNPWFIASAVISAVANIAFGRLIDARENPSTIRR